MSTKYITSNWFYLLSKENFDKIIIQKWVYAIFLLSEKIPDFQVILEENSSLDFYWAFFDEITPNIEFVQKSSSTNLKIKNLYLQNQSILKHKIVSSIETTNSKSHINLTSIIKNNTFDIDSKLHIKKGSRDIDSFLNLENIFIWDKVWIKWIPKLFVEAQDIKSSHACSIEKISPEKLFYLESRWLDKQKSVNLLLESKFVNTFWCLSMVDDKIYQDLYKKFIEILQK